ncbi:competence protein ComEA [Okibacterium sp. HSC-33S16]|uniref:helix-hairpin-helix domain-containing protein n=1 Tax=Okibacterium sp. HSC-33S16 TaxID=2910965 RepID=UPI0020A218C3|nr:helix-hairpin-helix domain-containing protein [Okibacterium sp. HSC-33S16]MCP2030694.1 competence protein ComEA [Okibacterium sp. HSC-33S16]
MVVLLITGLTVAVVVSLLGSAGATTTLDGSPSGTPTSGTESGRGSSGQTVYVHILGAVAAPGVYSLRDGDRVLDAVAAAGGFTMTADQRGVNLARFVVDGEQILVPEMGAAPPGNGSSSGGASARDSGTVNINTATSDQLEELPRVGPEMASRIIAWRDANGPFTVVDELMNVTGIGQKTFDALKELVTV